MTSPLSHFTGLSSLHKTKILKTIYGKPRKEGPGTIKYRDKPRFGGKKPKERMVELEDGEWVMLRKPHE